MPVRAFDALLNAYFIGLCLLLVTGGAAGPDDASGSRLLAEACELSPWVAGFLALVAVRFVWGRKRPLRDVPFVRWLGAMGERLSAGPLPIYVLTAAWAVLLAAVAIRRHLAFDDNGDLAVFDQALWNTMQGRFLRSTVLPRSTGEQIIFADHFDPLQLLLMPLYVVAPSPIVLLVVQAVMLAAGAVPLYWLTRDRLAGRPLLAAVFPLLYLLYLPLRAANRYDYHPSALSPPLYLLALYFMDKRRWTPMTLCLVMAGLLKENLPIAGVTIGLYLLVMNRQRSVGLALVAVFGLWFYAEFAWIIPAFSGGTPYAHFIRYPAVARSARGLLIAPLVHPITFFAALAASPLRKLLYVVNVLGPVAFLPVLAPSLLFLGLPFLLQNLLSDVPHQTALTTHYSAELAPFVFHAAIAGAARVLDSHLGRRVLTALGQGARPCAALAVVLLAASLLFHGFPETFYLRVYARTPHDDRLGGVLRTIPADVPLSTWAEIAPHVAHRRWLFRFPGLGSADVEAEMVVLDESLVSRDGRAQFAAAVAALPAKGYDKRLEDEGILVFSRRRSQ